jgi:hypothetical protein
VKSRRNTQEKEQEEEEKEEEDIPTDLGTVAAMRRLYSVFTNKRSARLV